MKKIINGKKYDTETAKCIGTHQYSHEGDFRFELEELYVTKNGTYFLYGTGGPLSKYRVQTGIRSYSGGSDIKPLSEDEAKQWSEKYMEADEYIEAFGEVEEG